MSAKKVAIIVGTRPEAIKLIPVYIAMKQSKSLQPVLVSTGQHKEMLEQIFSFFEVQPDVELDVMRANQTLSELTSRLILRITDFINETQPGLFIVQGDTTTAFVGGLMAYYQKIPVAHVEAGLRTYDKYSPFPEEVNRRLIGTFANFNFAPTERAVKALEKENIVDIHLVGNTVVDSLLLCLKQVMAKESAYRERFASILEGYEQYTLITGHRRESFGEGFEHICQAIAELARRYPKMLFVYPVHLNPNVQKIVFDKLSDIENIRLIDPLPYDELVYLLSKVDMILTDSGGIQEEAPTFDVPIVVMREVTERQEGIDAGCAVLAGTNRDNIVEHFSRIMEDEELKASMKKAQNPYGDGTTAQQIVKILEKHLSS